MGQYINTTEKGTLGVSFSNKMEGLKEVGAEVIETPTEWEEGLVCLVSNGVFAAAGYAYDEREMNAFINGMNGRLNVWLKWNKAKDYAA